MAKRRVETVLRTASRQQRKPPPLDPTGGKRALVLCGGGITGLTYEVGALRALDDLLVGATVNDFDVYVGTSAGAIIAAMLAAGISPTDIALGFEGHSAKLKPPGAATLYRPNLGELRYRLLKLPRLVRQMAVEVVKHPTQINLLDLAGMLLPLLPSGVFDSGHLTQFLHDALLEHGFTDDFRELEKELHIVACALDSGERVVFSRSRHANVPISTASTASSALPVLFKPVRIDGVDYVDGGIKGISAIDVAVDAGATLIVVINPIVPIDATAMEVPPSLREQTGGHLADLGARGVYNQVFRGMLHDGMLEHLRLVRESHPDVDLLLIEPRPDDEKMFFHELMSFSARLMVLQHGYESVSNGLYDSWGYLRRIIPKHGLHITRRYINRNPRQIPVDSVDSPGLFRRLLHQTVFDRRPHVKLVEDEDEAV